MKVALVHDWLTGMRGGEKCLEVFCELFPQADLYTLLWNPGSVSTAIERMPIHCSFIDRLPGKSGGYRHYLPLFPKAIESLDVKKYDLVLSSSHCVAKGIMPKSGALHICYCLTPMRYVWDFENVYFSRQRYGPLRRWLINPVINGLRAWDVQSVSRVHRFIAISHFVSARIKDHYGRDSAVIYPPINTDFYQDAGIHAQREDFFLIVSALVPYKRLEIAIEAFRELPSRLFVIGQGTERRTLKCLASPNVQFLGWKDDGVVRDHFLRCRAVIFPGIEDLGIVPLEAQACGAPVIAYRGGGAMETVIEGKTGLFFDEQSPESLRHAIRVFERLSFDSAVMRMNAERFSRKRFVSEIKDVVRKEWTSHQSRERLPW